MLLRIFRGGISGKGQRFNLAVLLHPLDDFRSDVPAGGIPQQEEALVRVALPQFLQDPHCLVPVLPLRFPGMFRIYSQD